jgi:hypothetical protein
MAPLAIGVKCICPGWVAVRAVAVFSTAGARIILLLVVTIFTGNAIAIVSRMGHVIEEDVTCCGLENNSHRLFRWFL